LEEESIKAIASHLHLAWSIAILSRPEEIPHVSYLLLLPGSLSTSNAKED
jgi:hypothetical protein